MSTSARQLARVITRPVKKLQKPRPLKPQNISRHSVIDTANINIFDEIMVLAEAVASNLSSGNFDRNLQSNIISLSGLLKNYGQSLEIIYKDQLDRAFVIFRNGCRDENLDYTSRLHLLELIELRAMQWTIADGSTYYKHKYSHPDIDILSVSSLDSSLSSVSVFQNTQMLNSINSVLSQPLLLGPGELVKSSGKFSAPTKISGKNYCKDEVVIRNSDSGKVMGIKGRRVHMIEELSETVISFQKVNPGAKERLVQITGPTEEKITYAKQLMEETIKRNVSPVRSELVDKDRFGSNSSLNSTASEDSSKYGSLNEGSKRTLLHSFSTSDATIGEYKYTVTIGDDTLKITGTNPNLVTIAKLVLDEYFISESNDQLTESGFEDGSNYFDRAYASESEEEIFKVQNSASSFSIVKSSSLKDIGSAYEMSSPKISDIEKINNKEKPTDEVINLPESNTDFNSQKKRQEKCLDKGLEEGRLVWNSNTLSFGSASSKTEPWDLDDLVFRNFLLKLDMGDRMIETKTRCHVPLKIYNCEEILLLADSSLSRRFPDDWARISKEFPAIVKKPPIEWFDPKSYMQERPQESDAVVSIQSVVEIRTLDQE